MNAALTATEGGLDTEFLVVTLIVLAVAAVAGVVWAIASGERRYPDPRTRHVGPQTKGRTRR